MNRFGYLKVAAAVPHVRVADCRWNAGRAVELIGRAAERGAALVVFPELSLTGYTCGDLFLQSGLLRAAEESLADLLRRTADLPAAIVGMPVPLGPALYNCAVVIGGGTIRGVVPKTFIPNYSEFYEARHFSSGADTELTACRLCGQEVPFGRDLLFRLGDYATMGIEICEDMWVPLSPSLAQAVDGAEVLVNLSASPESAGKHDYLRALVRQQSERAKAAYIYCSAGFGESSTDLSFAGNGIIVENGAMLRETERFCTEEQLVAADVDIELLVTARRRTSTFAQHRQEAAHRVIAVPVGASSSGAFERPIPRNPYMPAGGEELAVRCREVLDIQSWGLMQRLDHTGCRHAVLGIGGDLVNMLQNADVQTGENAQIVEAFNGSFGSMTPLSFVLIFVIFILGFLFYALIAALVGASVSRMEDLAQAMQPYSLLGVLGFYLAYFPAMFTMGSLETGAASDNVMKPLSYYFPVSSPFSLPAALMVGKLSMPEVIVAVLILAVFVALVAVIVARVYEMIILHNGSRLKFMDIIKMAGRK